MGITKTLINLLGTGLGGLLQTINGGSSASSGNIDTSTHLEAVLHCYFDFQSATENALIEVFTSIDGGVTYDDVPFVPIEVDYNDTCKSQVISIGAVSDLYVKVTNQDGSNPIKTWCRLEVMTA